MPRVGRIYQRALCYHVLNRGVNRQPIFLDDADREYFMRLAQEYKAICGARVYHWVWMGNHFHMLVEVVHANLRGFAGGLQQAFAQYHHARHGSSGVFWQSRFKSPPVEIGSYLVRCGRYIERNPVRAGLITPAWAYAWSSARHYVEGSDDGLTDTNPYLGPFDAEHRREYGEALMSGIDDEFIRRFPRGSPIGGDVFAGSLRRDRGRQRVKRGRPTRSVFISSKHVANE